MKNCILIKAVLLAVFLSCLTACKNTEPVLETVMETSEEEVSTEEPVVSNEEEETKGGTIYVHVCGAVVKPGVYELPYGVRRYEAIETAGGVTAEACADYLNLAEVLHDGERFEIPTVQNIEEFVERQSAQDSSSDTKGDNGLVNINTADVSDLCTLPGVGESRAQAIIAYRQEHGNFKKKEDIMQITGIKEGMYSKIEAYICVD